jgi:hypothetical protein
MNPIGIAPGIPPGIPPTALRKILTGAPHEGVVMLAIVFGE